MGFTIAHFVSTLFTLIFMLSAVHARSLPSKTKKGRAYDCVDFSEQHSFTNLALKNHTSRSSYKTSSVGGKLTRKIFDDGVNNKVLLCPNGTFPIFRTPNQMRNGQDHCIAVVRTRANPSKQFYGVEGSPSLHKIMVSGAQWSAARINLSNGLDSIEVGWMVNPSLFSDGEAHIYVRSQVGANSCIIPYCPGFVQVSKEVHLGDTPLHYSQYGGTPSFWRFFIDKHQDDGHWRVSMGNDKKRIGYWPKEMVGALSEYATQVEWGGEISNPGDVTPVPWIGCGRRADYDTARSAFIRHATVVDESMQNVEIEDTEKVKDCPNEYDVLDMGYQGQEWGHLIFHGGPVS